MSAAHTAALRPGALLEARMAAAYKDGRATAKAREPRVCPWRGDSAASVDRVLARMWARGYSAGNPIRLP